MIVTLFIFVMVFWFGYRPSDLKGDFTKPPKNAVRMREKKCYKHRK